MIGGGFTLVAARMGLGRWGAVKVTFVYLILRGFITFAVGGVMHHTIPHFRSTSAPALVVEAAAYWLGTDKPLRFALAAGALVGTLGLFTELLFVNLWGFAASGRLPLEAGGEDRRPRPDRRCSPPPCWAPPWAGPWPPNAGASPPACWLPPAWPCWACSPSPCPETSAQ